MENLENNQNSNTENLKNSNNQNLRGKNRAIFDEMASAVKDYDPKEEQRLKNKRNTLIVLVLSYLSIIFLLLNYFDFPKELNLNEAKTHIGKVANIEIPMPKFGRRPYHDSNSCFIHFENLDGTKEKLVASNCIHEIIPKIWKTKEIKIYETPIFHWSFIYQLKRYDGAILYEMTNSEFMEATSDKLAFIKGAVIIFLPALYYTFELINLKRRRNKREL